MGIINEKFMLYNKTGEKLFNDFARDMPIIDYHCHLAPELIEKDYKFKDAYDLFLSGDHYKWRQMRSFGIDEEYITGEKSGYEKWLSFAKVMPYLIGNPLYHWTALELKRYFDIDLDLNEDNAMEIWNICNEKLQSDNFSARALINKSNVEIICTTDDPSDNLEAHRKIAEDKSFRTKVLPTFRPDKVIGIDKPWFDEYISINKIDTYDKLIKWLNDRIEYFNNHGCSLADHGLDYVPYEKGDAKSVFEKKINGKVLTREEIDIFKTLIMKECAERYAKLGWTMQLHIGALRNNNTRMFKLLGADTGFDSINDLCVAEKLSAFLNDLDKDDMLPKTILYTLNPKDNYVLGTMLGNFQRGPVSSKIQFGSGWWFNDNRDGMEEQMKCLANLGVLGKFVGMLTDSRSFVSYPRHEYFRRILCNLIGGWVEKGEYSNDKSALEKIVKGICYSNAKEYFGF